MERYSKQQRFALALLVSTVVSAGFYVYGAWRNHNAEFSYLLWNLFLAWIPLLLTFALLKTLKTRRWSSWPALGLSCLWLVFLPNSFYMISDFIHLQNVTRVDILYDAVMFTSFIYSGVLLGMSSLYLMHLELKKRMPPSQAAYWIGLTLFICSFAIYVGRDLRWNSWDILTNPGGLLFDVSDRLLHLSAYPQMIVTVAAFFVLLGSMYAMMWSAAVLLAPDRR